MFKKPSTEKELLDHEDIPAEDLYRNLHELNFINTWLGGHRITRKIFKKFIQKRDIKYSVADVGCGGGDNLKVLAIWARKAGIEVRFYGIDKKSDCIAYAQENCKEYPEISFIHKPYEAVDMVFDITFSSLFCHHLPEDALDRFLNWSKNHSKLGFFINDLHRHPLAYYSIKMLTQLFSKSHLVKNDAPLSVLRGLKKHEWISALQKASVPHFAIRWQWAFRYAIWVFLAKEPNTPIILTRPD